MKRNWFCNLKIRLRWILRGLRRRNPTPTAGTDPKSPWKLLRTLLIRAAELWHLIRLLISLIRRSGNGSAKS